MRQTNKFFRLLCLTLTVVMLFSLTGCFSHDESDFQNDSAYNDNENDNVGIPDNQDNQNSDNLDYENTNSSEFGFNYDGMLPYIQKTEVPQGFIGIYTVDDLLNSDINQNENYILMSDLDLSGIDNWTGITNKSVFDGNGYTISNLKSDCSGLFNSAENVSNLNLVGIEIEAKINHRGNIGGICNVISGSISGCSVSGSIDCDYYGEDRSESYANVGGLVGKQQEGGNISFCKNNATIFMEAPIGYNAAVGGIAGTVIEINDCINYGDVTLETEASDGLDDPFTLEIEQTETNPEIQDNVGAGGISGQTSYGNIRIDACRNEGNVYSNNVAAGILGSAYFKASDSILITNCSNTGRVLGYGYADGVWVCAAGGILGTSSANGSNIIENCFNSGEVGSHKEYYPDYDVTYVGAIIGFEGHLGKLDAEFTVRNTAYCTTYPENGLDAEASGIGAMYSSNVALSDDDLKDINNYNFTNKNLWQNSTSADTPYPFYTHNYP